MPNPLSPDDIRKQALTLPEAARADLAAELIDSLDPHVDDAVDDAWQVEIQRRVAELDAGAVIPVPWSQVRQKIGLTDEPTQTR